jgi:hypothetical protein
VDVRVGRDERCLRYPRRIPEAALVQVREVEQDARPVALADQLLPRVREAGTCVRRRREPEGDTVSVGVGSAPHEAERTEAHLVEVLQSAWVRAEVLGAFEVEDRRKHAFAQARLDL